MKQDARGLDHHRAEGPKTIRGGQTSGTVNVNASTEVPKSIRGGAVKGGGGSVDPNQAKRESTGFISRLIGTKT